MNGSERVVRETLRSVARRLLWRHLLQAVATGAAAGAIVTALVAWTQRSTLYAASAGFVVALVVTSAWIWRSRRWRTTAIAARAVERDRPELRNLLVTSEELLRNPGRAREWIRARVLDDTAAIVGHGGASRVPVRRAAILASASMGLWAVTLSGVHRPAVAVVRGAVTSARAALTRTVTVGVTVTPPRYTAAASYTLENPERVEVLEGGRIHLSVTGRGGGWRVRVGPAEVAVTRDGDRWMADVNVTASGYLAIEPLEAPADGRRLIAVTAVRDRVPGITVDEPGRDVLLADATQRIPIRATASDDLGLRSLELRYTKVSGTGEQFEFVEGTLPLRIDRDSPTSWRAHAELALASLRLEQGDSIAYRLVARDGRPGDGGLGSSDTYLIEVGAPAQAALAGAELPPDQDRYALSQQMIVLKIERLRAREAGMPAAERRDALETLAAEQRAVRANFIFLMGGHVEDEEEEAEQSHEIQEGRLENRARRDIAAAVRHMTLAERGLAAASTSAALPPAKAAVEALQRAFGHSRYILRAAPVRSRIDPERRLSGALRSASDWYRQAEVPKADTPSARARSLLGRLLSVEAAAGSERAKDIARLAQEALAVDPESADWQEISRAIAQGHSKALVLLNRQAQKDALPRSDELARPSRLWSAWSAGR